MSSLIVDTAAGKLLIGEQVIECAIGRGGACEAADKREGNGCTPLGNWPVRAVLLRPDRGLAPPAASPWRWLRRSDGWSDDPNDPAYNRPTRHPYRFSAERMWRDDGLYDVVIVLGHNDRSPIAGMGSAIFLHIRGEKPTEGCVAVSPADMRTVLATLSIGDEIAIR